MWLKMPSQHSAAFSVAKKWDDNERGATFLVSERRGKVGWTERGGEDSMEAGDWLWERGKGVWLVYKTVNV